MTNNDKVPELIKSEFEDFISEGVVLIDFHADWCMPCIMMAPVLDELSEEFKGKIKMGKVNIEENQEIAQKFGVMSIPNFILFKNGKKEDQFTGAIPIDQFSEKLQKYI